MKKLKDTKAVHTFLQGTGIIMITTPNCGTCDAQKAAIEAVKGLPHFSILSDIKEFEVTSSLQYPLAALAVTSAPSIVFLKEGAVVAKITGFNSVEAITNLAYEALDFENEHKPTLLADISTEDKPAIDRTDIGSTIDALFDSYADSVDLSVNAKEAFGPYFKLPLLDWVDSKSK